MLSLVSPVQRALLAETCLRPFRPAFLVQNGFSDASAPRRPCAGCVQAVCRLCVCKPSAGCVQAVCRLCASRGPKRCAPHTLIQDGAALIAETLRVTCNREQEQRSCARWGTHPSPRRSPKSTPPMACGQSIRCRARAPTSPCFDQRIKLFFVSEPPWSLFYWLQGQQAEGPCLGTSLERFGR